MPGSFLELQGASQWRHPVYVEHGFLSDIAFWRDLLGDAAKIAIVTDRNVKHSVLPDLLAALADRDPLVHIVEPGETSKNRDAKVAIETSWIQSGLGRDGLVIALGGGVVGDLAGYCAATYLRGIPVIQVPTSLVAMVDSSLGGKTGIDIPEGKNLIGAFHPPAAVVADVSVLKTLPDDEMRNGLAEVVKHGVIADADLLEFVTDHQDAVFARDLSVLTELVQRNVKIKGSVVASDEKEGGLRQILNFGHTVGHAIEQLCMYQLPHGQAVSLGMVAELEMAVALRNFTREDANSLGRLLLALELPVRIEDKRVQADAILRAGQTDKKARQNQVRYALPNTLGRFDPDPESGYTMPVAEDVVQSALSVILC